MTAGIPPGPAAAALRRALGPVPWCALECLLERSDDGRTAAASVRALAADLGVAKNTAHRALATLVRSGLISPVQQRDQSGRFCPGRYALHVDSLLRRTPAPATTSRTGPRQRATAPADTEQLTLSIG